MIIVKIKKLCMKDRMDYSLDSLLVTIVRVNMYDHYIEQYKIVYYSF